MEIELAPLYKAFFITELTGDVDNFTNYILPGNKNLYISNDYTFSYKKFDEKEIYLLGYCLDIRDGSLSTDEIVSNLLNTTDKEAFYDEVDYLNGRFTLIYTNNKNTFVTTDATSMKPVFYNPEYKLISSHEYVIKKLLTDKFQVTLTQNLLYRKGFMDFTYNKEVFKLNPSIEIEINDFTRERIFPRRDKGVNTIENGYEILVPYFAETIKWLKNQPNKIFSLTGGQDSRLTLAILKSLINDMGFFTYLKQSQSLKRNKFAKRQYSNDEMIVDQMVDNLNLKHEFFTIPDLKADDEYYQRMSETLTSNHSYGLSKFYEDNPKFHNALHIKSTIQSVAKSTFPRDLYMRNNIDSVAEALQMWSFPVGTNAKRKASLKKCIEDYMERNELSFDNIYDYHMLDMMFLEVRLGNFQSNITQETDKSLEVFNIINSRKMIEIFLSPELAERQKLALNQIIIDNYWPVLNFFGINDEPEDMFKQVNQLKHELDEALDINFYVKEDMEIVKRNNLTISKSNRGLIIKPKNVPLLPEEEYPFEIVNNRGKDMEVTLTSTYKNPKGKGVISIKTSDQEYDILKFNKGMKFKIPAKGSVNFSYSIKEEKNKLSWLNAGTIIIR